MLEVRGKPIVLHERPSHVIEEVLRAFERFAASAADQVMVMSFVGVVVDEVIAGFALDDATQALESVQRAVDRGLVDSGHLALHVPDDVLRREMGAGIVEDVSNQSSLWSEPEAFFPYRLETTHRYCTWLHVYTASPTYVKRWVARNWRASLSTIRDTS
jgi:hypothetical protein